MSFDGAPEPPPRDIEVEVDAGSDSGAPDGQDVDDVVNDVKDVLEAVNNEAEPRKKVRKRKKRRMRSPMPGVDPSTGIAMVGGPPPPPSKPVLDGEQGDGFDLEEGDGSDDGMARRGRKLKQESGPDNYVKSVALWPSWGGGRRSRGEGKDVRMYSRRKRKSSKGRSTSETPATRGFSNIFMRSGLRAKDGRGRQAVDSTDLTGAGEAPAPPPKSVRIKADEVTIKEKDDVIMMPPMKFKNKRDPSDRIMLHKVMCFIFCFLLTAVMAFAVGYYAYNVDLFEYDSPLLLGSTGSPTAFPTPDS